MGIDPHHPFSASDPMKGNLSSTIIHPNELKSPEILFMILANHDNSMSTSASDPKASDFLASDFLASDPMSPDPMSPDPTASNPVKGKLSLTIIHQNLA